MPEHIKDGQLGNFLENNVDWALSREQYWGTPLPIWVCEETGKAEAVSSYDALLAKPGARAVKFSIKPKQTIQTCLKIFVFINHTSMPLHTTHHLPCPHASCT